MQNTAAIVCRMVWLENEFANNGGRSSVGRAPDCDSGRRGFEPHRPPQFACGELMCANDGCELIFSAVAECVT